MECHDHQRLIDEIVEDNPIAFRKFFDFFYPRLLRIANFYMHNHENAEEVVLDVFVKLWKNRKKLPEISHFNNYAYTAVKNQSLKYLSKKHHELLTIDEKTTSKMIEYAEPEKLFIGKELAIKMESLVSTLPPRCQIIFRMVREDGLKYREVASILNISQNAVENQMHIAIKRVQKVFEKYTIQSDSRIFPETKS